MFSKFKRRRGASGSNNGRIKKGAATANRILDTTGMYP